MLKPIKWKNELYESHNTLYFEEIKLHPENHNSILSEITSIKKILIKKMQRYRNSTFAKSELKWISYSVEI